MKSIIESIIGRKGSGKVPEVPIKMKNLEKGDIVQWKNGEYRIFPTTNFFGYANVCTGFCEDEYLCDISNFDENLRCKYDHNNDVVRIFKASKIKGISHDFPTYNQTEFQSIIVYI